MFSIFMKLSNLTCFELYITAADTLARTCVQPPPIYASSLNLEGLDEYLNEAMNIELSFEEPLSPIYLIFILLLNDL